MFGRSFAAATVLVFYIGINAGLLVRAIDRPTLIGIGLCCIIMLAPVVLKRLSRLPVYSLALYAALAPFNDVLVTNSGATLMKVLGVATVASVLLSMVANRRAARPSAVLIIVLSLMAFAGTSVVWAISPEVALPGYFAFLNYIGFFAVLCLYRVEPSDMKILLGATIAGGIAAAGYAGFMFWHAQPLPSERLFIGASGHTDDPNIFAAALLTPLALVLMMFLRSRAGLLKGFWLTALLIVLYGFVANTSRGATISFAVMVAFLLLAGRYRKQMLWIAAIALLTIVTSPIMQRFADSDAASGGFRLDIWKVAWAAFTQYWMGGAGIGNFDEAFARYFLTVPHHQLYWYASSHSVIIRSAVELGIPGLLLVLTLWYLVYRELSIVPNRHPSSDMSLALQAAVIGLFVAGFSLDLLMIKYLWLTFALVVLMRSSLQTEAVAESTGSPGLNSPAPLRFEAS